MCGIAAVFSKTKNGLGEADLEKPLLQMLAAIRHRGDRYHFGERMVLSRAALGTNRLAIIDRDHGRQPVEDPGSGLVIVMNGEIYNFRDLRKELVDLGHDFRTESDTEVVLHAYLEWGASCLPKLDGIFGFVITDTQQGTCFAARDFVGVKPLYFGETQDMLFFASERKCFLHLSVSAHEIPPGCYWYDGQLVRFAEIKSVPDLHIRKKSAIKDCKRFMEDAVRKQVATDLPVAVIFSGGLDSTIILHLAEKFHSDVTAFSIGTQDSEDLEFARRFCRERDITHVVNDFYNAQIDRNIRSAIFDGEFFEPVDISDMLSMALVYSAVRANGFKVALSGDGSDEIFAGYDLFQQVNDPYALSTYRVNNLYRTDLQRTDRSSMVNSIECRVPFLDRALVEFALSLPFDLKVRNGVEKHVLREAFRSEIPGYMLDRPKIRMPEGIGIFDRVFNALGRIQANGQALPEISLDTPQVRNALTLFLEFGYDAPKERYKKPGVDYLEGGYFEFGQVSAPESV